MCRCASSGSIGVRHHLQCHRGGLHRAHLRPAGRGGGVVHLRRRRAVAGVSGVDEGAGRLGVLRGREPHRLPSLPASAVARPPARHDDGAVRRPLGAHADVVGHGRRLSRLPGALPVPAPPGPAGGGCLLPGAGGRAARVSPAGLGHARPAAGAAGLQLRRLRAGDACWRACR